MLDSSAPTHLHFVAADLERESVAAALTRTRFDASSPTCFAWPGVTMYLTRAAIEGTLWSVRSIAAAGSELIFDYLEADAFVPGKASERVRRLMEVVRNMGEPMLSGFEPATLRSELSALGFQLVEDLGPAELQELYFQGRSDGLRAPEHCHFVRARVN